MRACGGHAARRARRDRGTRRRRGQRGDRSGARGLDRRDQPECARTDQRPRQRRCRLRALRAGAGAAAVARRGGDPAAGGQHLPRPAPARRPLRPRAPAGDVQPRGRGPGELRRRRRPGDRPPAGRRRTHRPSGWAPSATATRCAGCWRPAVATGATARVPALSFEGPRAGRFGWRFDSEGQQHVVCELEDARPDMVVVGLGEPWYIDLKELACGRIETKVPHRVTRLLLRAPAVPASVASLVRQKLQPSAATLQLPEPLRKRERQEMRPTPVLHLHCPTRHHLARPGLEARGAGGRPAAGARPVRLCRCRHRLAGRALRDQPRQGQPPAGAAPRHAVRGADDRAPERARPAAPGPHRARPVRARELSPGLHLRGGRGRRRLDALGRVQSPGPAQARSRRLAHHLRRGLSLSGRRRRRRLEGRRQRLRHRLVRPRPRHRRRRRAGGTPADPARPVRAGARRICRPPHSTRSARTTSSARCRTAASCRFRPPG